MNRFKKGICLLLLSLLLLSMNGCSEGATTESNSNHILREYIGKAVLTYVVGSDTITLSGSGAVRYGDPYSSQLSKYIESFSPSNMVVEEGITELYGVSGPNSLKTLTLPQSLTTLSSSFNGCTNLQSIQLPDRLKTIASCFYKCEKLKTLTIPESIESVKSSFLDCFALEDLMLEGAPLIEASFENCTALKELTLPKDTVLCRSFSDCSALETIHLGANVSCHNPDAEGCAESFSGRGIAQRKIYAEVPLNMEPSTAITVGIAELNKGISTTKLIPVDEDGAELSGVQMPAPKFTITFDQQAGILTVSGTGSLSGTANKDTLFPRLLEESYEWDNHVILKEDHTVKKVVVQEGITGIFNCFNDLAQLEEVVLPESLTSIGCAFIGCTSLEQIQIPKNVERVYFDAFSDCAALHSVAINGPIDTCGVHGALNNLDALEEISIPEGSTLCNAFNGCENLNKVTLGKNTQLHEFPSDIDDSVCRITFSQAPKNCTFYVDSALYRFIFHPSYRGPIENAEQYKFIVTDGETFTDGEIFNNEQHQLFIPGS